MKAFLLHSLLPNSNLVVEDPLIYIVGHHLVLWRTRLNSASLSEFLLCLFCYLIEARAFNLKTAVEHTKIPLAPTAVFRFNR